MKDWSEIFTGKLFTPCRSETPTQLEPAAKFPVAGLRPGSDQLRCLRVKQRYTNRVTTPASLLPLSNCLLRHNFLISCSIYGCAKKSDAVCKTRGYGPWYPWAPSETENIPPFTFPCSLRCQANDVEFHKTQSRLPSTSSYGGFFPLALFRFSR